VGLAIAGLLLFCPLLVTTAFLGPKTVEKEKGPKKQKSFTDVENCQHSNLRTDEIDLAVKSARSVGKVSVTLSFK